MNRRFGKKCKCGHYESQHVPSTSNTNAAMRYDTKPGGNLPMGLLPTIHYDTMRDKCKICDCKKFEGEKRWKGIF